jgi:hypothetical protein
MNHLEKAKCGCPDPEACIGDRQILTQLDNAEGGFRLAPRPNRAELGLSMMIGRLSAEQMMSLVARRRLADGRAVRYTTAGTLRGSGFAVLHTPGRSSDRPHASIVWPIPGGPWNPAVPWDEDVQKRFDSCFNVVER